MAGRRFYCGYELALLRAVADALVDVEGKTTIADLNDFVHENYPSFIDVYSVMKRMYPGTDVLISSLERSR